MYHKATDVATMLAGIAMIATILAYIAIYTSAPNVTASNRVLGCFVMSIWSVSPYLAMIAASNQFGGRGLLALAVLGATSLSVALATYVVALVVRNPTDGQAGMSLAILPGVQWLILMLVAGVALVAWLLSRFTS